MAEVARLGTALEAREAVGRFLLLAPPRQGRRTTSRGGRFAMTLGLQESIARRGLAWKRAIYLFSRYRGRDSNP